MTAGGRSRRRPPSGGTVGAADSARPASSATPSAFGGNELSRRNIMVKCPFCGFSNEDGALFCEQCKSDLSAVAPAAAVEHVPVAEVIEATPVAPGDYMPVATAEVVQADLAGDVIPAAE